MINRMFDDSLVARESSCVVLDWEVGVDGQSGMVTGVMDSDCSLLQEWLGVEWVGYLGGVGDVVQSRAVLSSCRFWVGEEWSVMSCLPVCLLSNDDFGLKGCGGGDGSVSRELNLL